MSALAEYRPWKHALLWLGVFLFLAWRVPLVWQSGQFTGEDGWVFFAEAFNSPWHESIFVPFAGYLRLDARLVAELLSGLPLAAQPVAYGLVGLGVNALAFSAVYLPVFRSFVLSDTLRLGIVALLALAPNAENLGLLTGLHWYLAFAFVLCLLVPLPQQTLARAGVCLLMFFAVWSAPSTLVLGPLLAYRTWRATERFDRIWNLAATVQLGLAALLAYGFRDTAGERAGEFGLSDLPPALEVLFLRGWLGVGLVGQGVAEVVVLRAPGLVSIWGFLVLVSLAWGIWRYRRDDVGRGLALLLGAGGLMALLSLGRTAYVPELAALDLPRHVRYLTVPSLLLLLGLWGLVFQLCRSESRRLMIGLWSVQAGLLAVGLPGNQHWSRPVENFAWGDYVEAVVDFKARQIDRGEAASLYIPSDVPYWGVVLQSQGGQVVSPDKGVVPALGATAVGDEVFQSWLGRFRFASVRNQDNPVRIYHERLGDLTYTGSESGRVWFVDSQGAQWFTAPLLQPYWWRIQDLDMRLVQP